MKDLLVNKYSLLDVMIFQGTAVIILRDGGWLNALAFASCGLIISSLLKDRK